MRDESVAEPIAFDGTADTVDAQPVVATALSCELRRAIALLAIFVGLLLIRFG